MKFIFNRNVFINGNCNVAKHGIKICHFSLEAVKDHPLNKICYNQGKHNFPTFKVQHSILLENSSTDYPKEFQTNSQLKAFKEPLT